MSEAETSLDILKEVRDGLRNLSFRVDSLENNRSHNPTDGVGPHVVGHGRIGDPTFPSSFASQSQGAYSALSAPIDTFEADYLRVKASVQSVRLPSDLTLQESRQGIKKEDLPLFNIIAKNARFAETLLKICASVDKAPANTEDIFCVAYAHMKFLLEEYTASSLFLMLWAGRQPNAVEKEIP